MESSMQMDAEMRLQILMVAIKPALVEVVAELESST